MRAPVTQPPGRVLGLVLGLWTAAGAWAQMSGLVEHPVDVRVDSGWVENTGPQPGVVWSTEVHIPNATWLRLTFDDVQLAGREPDGSASYLLITSLLDGAAQLLNARHVREWQNTTAYFNGDAVLIELYAFPGTGPNRLRMSRVITGTNADDRSICGPTDDRVLSDDARVARFLPGGCTAWLIDDCAGCFLSAGHCRDSNTVIQFNVPLSNPDGSLNHPGPEDQYSVDLDSRLSLNQGEGNDWFYFGCFPNANTGLTPAEAQGTWFVTATPPPASGQPLRVTGYGTVSWPIPLTWYLVQKTHVAQFQSFASALIRHTADTTGGNSGSPIVLEATGAAIGIHTHGGCETSGTNSGTGLNHPALQNALSSAQGVCVCAQGIEVAPESDFTSTGPVGGPFQPTGTTYTMTNISPYAVDYLVSADVNWLTITNAAGTLGPGESVPIGVSINTQAGGLAAGQHTATVGFENRTNGIGDTSRLVLLTVGGMQQIYAWNFDTNPGWTTEGQWDFGQPTGQGGSEHGYPDPASGYTGTNVYGVNLSGDYTVGTPYGPYRLTSGPLDFSNATQVTLRFRRWLNTDFRPYVYQRVEASNNGVNWTLIWENPIGFGNEITENAWSLREYDLSAVADQQPLVYLRWSYGVGQAGAWAYSGWNIDDVEVWGFAGQQQEYPRGDMDCDYDVDFDDIDPFVAALEGREVYESQYPDCVYMNADCDADGDVDFDDIDAFVEILEG